MATDALYKVAYDEAVRALSEQQAIVESLRSRAGVLFSAAAITTSFLGARALHAAGWSPFSWLALVAFVGVAVAFLATLWPRRWEFAADPHVVIEAYVESSEPAALGDMHRDLSFHMHRAYLKNSEEKEKLIVFFQISNVLFALELVLWIAAIVVIS